MIARALLALIAEEANYHTMDDAALANIQRLALIYGMAGTGKSHLIRGLIAFATSWSRAHAVGTFAITGVTAIGIDGATFAHLTFAFQKKGMQDSLRTKWQGLRLLVIDEVSMITNRNLYDLDQFCRALTNRSCLPFGGLLVVVAGDFCQLPPVGGTYLYVQPNFHNHKRADGYNLWRTITNDIVVILNEVQRTKNRDFIALQEKIRQGEWNEDMNTTIRSRVGAPIIRPPASESDSRNPEHDYCPVLVTYNKTRAAIELQRLQAICNSTTQDDNLPILLLAEIRINRRTKPLSREEIDFMYNQPDNIFNKAAPYLALYRGARMLITDNLNVKCGLGQGTRARVIDWVFPDGTTFEIRTFKNCRVRKPSANPLFVLVELTSTPLKGKPPGQPPNLPPNVVALPMYKHNKASVNVTNVANNTRHSVTVRLHQLPLRPANALTTYAAQGSQFDSFVIHETNEREFYTQVSRAKEGLETISITTSTTLRADFAPATQEETEVELERLREQHVMTETTFEQETRQFEHRST